MILLINDAQHLAREVLDIAEKIAWEKKTPEASKPVLVAALTVAILLAAQLIRKQK